MDIVERLRLEIGGYTDDYLEKAEADMKEAADEIERLRFNIAFLLEALQRIAIEEDGLDHFGFAQTVIDEIIGGE